jgi:hypothetical protein
LIAKLEATEKNLVTKLAVIENIMSSIVWQLNFFNCRMFLDLGYPIDGGLIFTTDLVTKSGMPSNKM